MSSPGASSDGTWISDEPRFTSVVRWILVRALHRGGRVLAIALLATGAVVALRALKQPTYEATLLFRLSEGDFTEAAHAARPPRDIREQVANVALSRQQLERIMKKHGRSSAWLARDREAAIEAFREDIEISVERNYFIWDRSPGDAPRSAQVTISLSGADEEQTRAMLGEIGEAILRDQAAQRSGRLLEARELFRAQLELARARTRSLQETMERLTIEAAGADGQHAIALQARIAALEAEAKGAIERELALDRRAEAVAFGAAVEEEQLGMSLELLDERVAIFAPPLTPAQVVVRAAAVFALVLLLTAIAVGAFDDRIYSPEDLAAWGLPVLGALPRFPGDEAGSHRARMLAGRA